MKQSPRMKAIQENMQPGVITINGFLGDDKRDLVQILDRDNSIVRELRLTHQMIADCMQEFRDKGEKGLGEFIKVDPYFDVQVISVRGGIRCPFEDRGLVQKDCITVKNLKTEKEINYTDLSIHFIKAHGFYQGMGSLYRLDPEKLVEILEVKHRGLI
ncbi:MAG TPA: hypothetical protein QF753_04140 [Victivallales bacterium]|nr:hypothetical protein [Victivallales bacterium]